MLYMWRKGWELNSPPSNAEKGMSLLATFFSICFGLKLLGVVDLALNQSSQTLETNIQIQLGTICGGLFPKMYWGQICNLDVSFFGTSEGYEFVHMEAMESR